MPASDLNRKSVRELQRIATEAELPARQGKARVLSRAARLQLIDRLSRWGATGLAAMGGVSIYIAISAGRAFPARAAAWSLLVLMSIWACRTLRARFRAGEKISSRPFRWRANYTSALSVLGVAFGSGSILLIPAGAAPDAVLPIVALSFFAALAAGAAHAAHRSSAIAIAAPALLFGFAALARNGVDGLALGAAASLAVIVIALVAMMTLALYADARRRHPRTGFVRQEAMASESRRALAAAENEADLSASAN